jgi:enoyl-CoA hydratase
MTPDTVNVSVEDSVATIGVERPPVNGYNDTLMNDMREAILEVRYDEDVEVVVLTSDLDDVFSAGADIKFMSEADPEYVNMFDVTFHEMTEMIENTPKIFIAAINGNALGGGLEIALSCDLRFAVPDADLGLVEVDHGLLPAASGTQRLPRVLGNKSKALEMMLTGETVSGDRAKELGLVDRLYDADELLEETNAYAAELADGATKSIGVVKQVVSKGTEVPLSYGMSMERQGLDRVFQTADAREGMEAFKERREPEFTGE